jgi:signal transduction histidine kinase
MTSAHHPRPEMPKPSLFEARQQALCLESTLNELTLYQFQVESVHTGLDVVQVFEQHPRLPGVVLLQERQFVGMISRQRLLEYLIHPHGLDLFLQQPLSVLHSYARTANLILPQTTSILASAQRALRRSPDQQGEPIIVQMDSEIYRLLNVHELNIAYWQIRGIETQVRYERAQAQLIQSKKMASLGRLVDGVAHEILDPVGFIWGNLVHVATYTEQLMELLSAYEAHFPQLPAPLHRLKQDIELEYVRQDLPRTIDSIRSGAERLKKLVTSLQNFCHIDQVYPKPADLHECLDSILLLLKSGFTGNIEIIKNYGCLPPVTCYLGQLSQVFMNILTNAIDILMNQAVYWELIDEFNGREISAPQPNPTIKPQIMITTEVRSHNLSTLELLMLSERVHHDNSVTAPRWVSIRITDNGPGLHPEQYQKILDSFLGNKHTAKETSLALSYQMVTAKHGGKFYLHSPVPTALVLYPIPAINPAESSLEKIPTASQFQVQPSSGTEFEILLPLI